MKKFLKLKKIFHPVQIKHLILALVWVITNICILYPTHSWGGDREMRSFLCVDLFMPQSENNNLHYPLHFSQPMPAFAREKLANILNVYQSFPKLILVHDGAQAEILMAYLKNELHLNSGVVIDENEEANIAQANKNTENIHLFDSNKLQTLILTTGFNKVFEIPPRSQFIDFTAFNGDAELENRSRKLSDWIRINKNQDLITPRVRTSWNYEAVLGYWYFRLKNQYDDYSFLDFEAKFILLLYLKQLEEMPQTFRDNLEKFMIFVRKKGIPSSHSKDPEEKFLGRWFVAIKRRYPETWLQKMPLDFKNLLESMGAHKIRKFKSESEVIKDYVQKLSIWFEQNEGSKLRPSYKAKTPYEKDMFKVYTMLQKKVGTNWYQLFSEDIQKKLRAAEIIDVDFLEIQRNQSLNDLQKIIINWK